MSKCKGGISRAEERALEFYPMKDYNKEPNYIHSCDSKMLDEVYRDVFRIGYEAAEKDLTDVAAFSSGPDGFYYGRGYQQGKKDAEKDLALTPDDIKLITKIHYEIVFKDTTGTKVGNIASEVLKRYLEAKR